MTNDMALPGANRGDEAGAIPGAEGADAIYQQWFPVYYELTTLALDSQTVRHSPQVIERFQSAGWHTTPQVLDAYWHRVDWISRHCRGRVLEISCGMGNVTRWIASRTKVERVLAVDVQESYIAVLKKFAWPKVTALCRDVTTGGEALVPHAPFDTVVLAELIEHLTPDKEIALIDAVRPYLSSGALWVISTPIGFMKDPDHVRGFGRRLFRWHVRLLYGRVLSEDDNRMQQYVVCQARETERAFSRRGRHAAARVLERMLGSKPAPRNWRPWSRR
jgi:2-polyprenyl-3-methyl-5-hydroxy-6-metoxy-1,4-benzoquinol methylase